MALDQILRGKTQYPLYGKNGTVLYSTAVSMTCAIVISWTGGSDVDICGFFSHCPNSQVGWSHGASIDCGDGFTAAWGGDNTSGGPETVDLAYSGNGGIAGKSFEIHLNWYSTGSGSGGPATVTATDSAGNVKTFSISPSSSTHKAATPSNPGVRINFNNDGTLKSITAA